MKGKLFFIHWEEAEVQEYTERLGLFGWQVETESEDGARAFKRIKESLPDVIVISLSRLPSHGRETADALRSTTITRAIPVIFIDGNEEAIAKTRLKVPDAIYTTSKMLNSVLDGLK